MRKLTWIIVALLIAGGLLALRRQRIHDRDAAPLARQPIPVVEVATVRHGTVGRSRQLTGTVIAGKEAHVAPQIMARIREVRVREGDTVRRGQVLAILDSRELEDAVAQASAGLSAARQAVAAAEAAWEVQRNATSRDRVLHDARAISDEQWERSQATERATRARLEGARAQLEMAAKRRNQARIRRGHAILKAPLDGKVTARLADPGDLAIPGKPVIIVAQRRGLRVRAQLPVADLAVLAVGNRVTVSAAGTKIRTAVSRIVPATGPSGLAVFEADLPEAAEAFVPGATVGVDVELRRTTGLVVPVTALLEGEHGALVFLVQSPRGRPAGPDRAPGSTETLRPCSVRVLIHSTDEAVIEGQLTEGDRVVVARPSRLMTLARGMTVEVAPGNGRGAQHELR